MPYRDALEACPRCALALVDARSARGCQGCGGLWVGEAVLTEMVLAMLPPRPLGRLVLAVVDRADPLLACPSCQRAMEPTSIHEVILDRCPAGHGVWFDAEELQAALRRVADPELAPPLAELPSRLSPRDPWPAVVPAPRPPPGSHAPEIALVVHEPDRPPRAVTLRQDLIKIGRLSHLTQGHLYLADGAVSRIHAIIEATPPADVAIIDLGSAVGTKVNGELVARQALRVDDVIAVGGTTIRVVAIAAAR